MPTLAERIAALPDKYRKEFIASLSDEERYAYLYTWTVWARENQVLPTHNPRMETGEWFGWLRMAGRGEGKTRTGAETIREWVGGPKDAPIRIALVAETASDARDVMIQGESGILSVSPPDNMPEFQPSKRRLVWPNGSTAILFSGEDPDQLRGPQFHKAWVDELAKYSRAEKTWDNLEFSLRLGKNPQVIVTTTPRPIPVIKKLLKDPMIVVSRGSSYDNIHNLAPSFIHRIREKYEGTRLGEQEIYAKVLTDVRGALWTYDLLERQRVDDAPDLKRIVIGVDPAVSTGDDANETGIVAVGRGLNKHGFVLEDVSGNLSPDGWARKAVALYDRLGADLIVGEVNNGGDLVEMCVRSVRPNINFRKVSASRGKSKRAEPVAALYEQGKMWHVGRYAKLEDQCTSTTVEGYEGGGSPDRMDAMVWAATEVMLGDRPAPIVRPTSVEVVSPYSV